MPAFLTLSLAAVFICIAVVMGYVTSRALEWAGPERRRVRDLAPGSAGVVVRDERSLVDDAEENQFSKLLPKSPKEMGRLRRQMIAAGQYDLSAAVYYSAAKFGLPIALGLSVLALRGTSTEGLMYAGMAAVVGYLVPDLVLVQMTRGHERAIRNGLPDALDLMIVCIEAGSGLDQAILKSSEEFDLVHPALAREMRLIITETRAGKPRMEAFQNFASRTRVEEVRSLVTMLMQTDRFGTSVALALRTHAEDLRTKRRQRAEERAAKIGAKLVFPLALCIFPTVYAVCLGPVMITIYRGLFSL